MEYLETLLGNWLRRDFRLVMVLVGSIMGLALILSACQAATPAPSKTQAPAPQAEQPAEPPAPMVDVVDQVFQESGVTIAEVVSAGPGWLVVHAQAEGKPGPILGYAAVKDGVNKSVMVEIDAVQATETLYAMLHADVGEVGKFEFPDGVDVPIKVDAKMISPAFAISGLPAAIPSVAVEDQEIADGNVTIAEIVSQGPGWLVVHAQADGKPGPILGYAAVEDGFNEAVVVEIDTAQATETLYAMLHTDAGELGKFEFPNGPDVPAKLDEKVITPPFTVSGLPGPAPAVAVDEQEIVDGSVTIAEVESVGPGWLVVHAQADGKPGPILGYAAVEDGINEGVTVEIDTSLATETLYAMLHTDAGELGKYEFPDGADVPVKVADQIITPPFAITGGLEPTALVVQGGNDELGAFLTGPNGLTLYIFTKDKAGVSNCYDQCADNWPPLLLEDGQELLAGEGIDGELGTIERADGGIQIAYNGLPLYYWIGDAAPGDATGNGFNGVWLIATVNTVAPVASSSTSADSGGDKGKDSGGGY